MQNRTSFSEIQQIILISQFPYMLSLNHGVYIIEKGYKKTVCPDGKYFHQNKLFFIFTLIIFSEHSYFLRKSQITPERKQRKKIFFNSICTPPEHPNSPQILYLQAFSQFSPVPGHTTLSSKGKIQYPHYPHTPLQSHTAKPHSKSTQQIHTAKPYGKAKPSGTAAQFHSTFRSGNPDNPTSIASHITVSSYTAALSQCHFRSIIQSIPHTLQHQEISTFRSVTHALVVSQQTHAVMFSLLLLYTENCKIQRGFLQLLPISRCLFTPHFI